MWKEARGGERTGLKFCSHLSQKRPRDAMPRRYSCSLISHTTAYQVAKPMASLPQILDGLRTAAQAHFTSGFTLPESSWGAARALLPAAGLPSPPAISKEKSGCHRGFPLKIPKPSNLPRHLGQTTLDLLFLRLFWKSPLPGLGDKSWRQF